MANGVNKVILLGNIGQEPEVRYTSDQKPIVNLSLATSESWKDKNTNEKKQKTEWHRVVFFGALAGVAAEYLAKGKKIYIEGKLQTRKWQDSTGQDRYTTEVVVDNSGTLQMLDSKQASQQNNANGGYRQQTQGQQPANPNGGYQQPANNNGYQQQPNNYAGYQQGQPPVNNAYQQEPDFASDIPF